MKILLLEDRPKRQQQFIDDLNTDLTEYSDILDNETEKYFYESILNDEIDLSQYSIIISHRSIAEDKSVEVVDKLKEHCNNTDTPLVLFSGGISTTYYNEEDYTVMELNSKTFYSQNLKLFLESCKNGDENILMLCYGEHWRLNIVLNTLEKINLEIEKCDDEKIHLQDFLLKIDTDKLQSLAIKLHEIKSENNRTTTKDEIIKYKNSIVAYIKEIADE